MQSKYDVSEYGFLPSYCYRCLPKQFECYQRVIDNLEETKCNGDDFRDLVKKLPVYDKKNHSVQELKLQEVKFLYSILTMVMNRYVWCTGVNDAKKFNKIPAIIAIPLYECSNKLGIVISLTHASVDLWNWHLINKKKRFSLDNINTNYTITGNLSEQWFYKIMIAIEGIAGNVLITIPNVHKSFNNNKNLIKQLRIINQCIIDSTNIITRMKDHCNPDFFFNNIRIYLSGSENDNLPNGVILDLGETKKTIKYAGGSAAQSTLIQVYDAFFGIEHTGHGLEFLVKMQDYMPEKHRKYLKMVKGLPSLKDHVQQSTPDVKKMFDKCVNNIALFRKEHLVLVHNYIMKFVGVKKPTGLKNDSKNAHSDKGSGGTSPVQFCTEIIQDTQSVKMIGKKRDNWWRTWHWWSSLLVIVSVIILFCNIFNKLRFD
jgi:indoleamine 2,3-dioxygenase